MHAARLALVLAAGCGRIWFDPLDDAGASDVGPAVVTFPPSVCGVVRVPAPPVTMADIAVGARRDRSGLAIATAIPNVTADLTLTDAGRQVTSRTSLSVVANMMGSIADAGQRLFIIAHAGTIEVNLSTAFDGSDEQPVMSFGGVLTGRDCLAYAPEIDRLLHANGRGTDLDLRLVGPAATLGSPVATTVGDVHELSCTSGPDHVHVNWRALDGTCNGVRFDSTPMPVFGGSVSLANCRNLRGALGDPATDESMVVFTNPGGQIAVQHITTSAAAPQVIASTGSGAKIAFDGIRFWTAWVDHRAPTDRLRVGHVTTAGVSTDVEFPILPAGNEAFELVRDGDRVDLVVRETDVLNVLQLCP